MFTTDGLVDSSYLHSKGQQITATRPVGDKCVFEFADLDPTEAARLLAHPDRQLVVQYQRSLRHVRKLIDVSLYSLGQRL